MQSVDSDFLQREVKTTTQAERIEREEEESEEARERKEQAKNKAKAKAQRARENGGNPVFIGNAALLVIVGAGLGLGAYKKHTQGKLSWELVGLWTGAVGAFGAVDYFVSKYVPPRPSLTGVSVANHIYVQMASPEQIPSQALR